MSLKRKLILKILSMKVKLSYIFLLVTLFSIGTTGVSAQEVRSELPKEKQTTLGLYVTAKEAFDKWKADPAKVKILDVRTQEEYLYIGHPVMAWNIPLLLQVYEWDTAKQHFPMKPNPDFMKQIKEVFQPDDIILVTCRSGSRSAKAVNQLAEAGFKNVYNITDGFEGDKVEDPNSVFLGQRLLNGWKNSGLPYTYNIDPKLMLIPGYK
jgi:rhodanese-related sulfurtransferase